MANACGINVPKSEVMKLGNKYHTFLVKRFDRTGTSRHFFSSAMTVLKRTDGESGSASYLDLAEFINDHGAAKAINQDMEELFRRVVFNVVTGNRDDHLRNHGFKMTGEGWRLAPAYDMNPSYKKGEHELAIDAKDHRPCLDTVLETAPFYQLERKHALKITGEVVSVVAKWQSFGKKLGLSSLDGLRIKHLFITEHPLV